MSPLLLMPSGEVAGGMYDWDNDKIYINVEMKPKARRYAVQHEKIHRVQNKHVSIWHDFLYYRAHENNPVYTTEWSKKNYKENFAENLVFIDQVPKNTVQYRILKRYEKKCNFIKK